MQNGVANEPAALRLFEDVYGVCVVCPALHLEPGVVEAHAAPVTGILDVGRFPHGVDARSEAIAAAFARVDLRVGGRGPTSCGGSTASSSTTSATRSTRCAVPTPRRGRCNGGRGRRAPSASAAAGIDAVTPEEDAARRGDVFQWGGSAARSRGPGASSWQSLARGTGSIEADYLNGEIVLLGRLHGVPTPVNLLLQQTAARAAREGLAARAASGSTN